MAVTREVQPFTALALDAIEKSNHGRYTGLVERLCLTVRRAWSDTATLKEICAEKEQELVQLASDEPDGKRVLCLLRHDGFLQVFAEPGVAVKIAYLPKVALEREERAVEVLELMLSRDYRELLYEARCEIGHVKRCLTPAKMLTAQHEMSLVKAINGIRDLNMRTAMATAKQRLLESKP